ncbi:MULTISPECIES: trans-sulfuration enzyme family protein [Actinopolyspora]|uniref:homocysteine desulfhydrase n=1 Tax=Actinopolyspora saharensis TaxID=995062 RepID=A0A1H0ZQQ1_9ACTN|nr:aminotransferase class I/II-fold pyridoxal phosphate-dependent enzyme [Actinopolyspora saharensis]NHD15652.1 aminotransferase class I/II-fold pyridoxal phosphate-dependent enzyme [Actinopolyspora sp. BKK2]NHE75134.1 aminotransferase class I/II-fold pyridoxal phosphate-dependent enzyme [Actinopolyspora sp. BKK1]SDQ29356.1 Cystathionine beta-lyase/cystathionine gamma-synthase [Actinopolyspora saharensis]
MNDTDRQICTGPWDGPGSEPGAVAPPIYQTSLFAKPSFAEFVRQQAAEHENFVYSRGSNPTVAFLEERLALLERGETAKCFASGMGAIGAVLAGLLRSGEHVLFVNTIYGPTLELADHLERFGIEHTVLADPAGDVAEHIRANTALIYVESPGTMLMKVVDLPGLAALARERGIRTVMDNTWSTPLFQKPLAAGVDLVVHSLTKYIGGHSDVLGGAVIGSRNTVDELFHRGHQLFGAVMSALEASLVLRGLRTLPVRMEQHQHNALRVIDYLRARSEVLAVHHPHAEHDPDEELITTQFSGFSGLVSFELRQGTFERVSRFVDALTLFRIGPSWGGYESLVTSPVRPDDESGPVSRPGLIRLSVGLEGARSQLEDLDRGFAALAG